MKKSFDLYKAIIVASIVLMPVAGGWLYWLEQRVAEGHRAIESAKRPRTGELQRIGTLLQEIDTMAKNAGAASSEGDPGVYFDRQISRSSSDFRKTDYDIKPQQPVRHGETKSRDLQYRIEFKRENKAFPLSRTLIEAILYNVEGNSPAWRLRTLTLRSEDTGGTKNLRSSGVKPPPELSDNWFVENMLFARREPDPQATPRSRGR